MYEEETFSVSSSPVQELKQGKSSSSSSSSPRRSSRFGRRFFRNRKSNRKVENAENAEKRDENSPTFNMTASSSRDSVSMGRKIYGASSSVRLDVPVVTPWTRKVLAKPPPASEAAFGGPPRYDWIDIETAAAVKVQAVYRRDKAMRELEKQGITTVAIRNRARTRQRNRRPDVLNGDLSGLFCCGGIGFSLDDFTPDDYAAQKEYEKSRYQQKKKSKQQREEQLRHDFAKPLQAKRQEVDQVEEVYEVVE